MRRDILAGAVPILISASPDASTPSRFTFNRRGSIGFSACESRTSQIERSKRGAVLDDSCSRLEEQLADACGFEDRITIAEQCLLKNIPRCPVLDPVTTGVRRITVSRGCSRMDDLVAGSGWTVRQLERKCLEEIGVGPKLFGRIVRLNQALDTKVASAKRTWTEIPHELGINPEATTAFEDVGVVE
jgi:hypothetical protein